MNKRTLIICFFIATLICVLTGCAGGKNYAIYIYMSGKYSGLVASVVELTKNQMDKFGLW